MALTFNMLENYFFIFCCQSFSFWHLLLVAAVISYQSHLVMPYKKIFRTDVCVSFCLFCAFVDKRTKYISFRSTDVVARFFSLVPSFYTWSHAETIFIAPNHQVFLSYHVMRNPVLQLLQLLPRFPFIHQMCVCCGCSVSVCPATDVLTSPPSFHIPTPISPI